MSLISFYQKSLLIPPVFLLLGVSLSLFKSDKLFWFVGLGFWGLILGGIPYIALASWLVVQSRKYPIRWLKGKLVLAPILLLPLIVIWIFFISFLLSIKNAQFSITDYLGFSMLFSIVTSIYAILTGYFFVIIVFVSCSVLQRYGFVERESPLHETSE